MHDFHALEQGAAVTAGVITAMKYRAAARFGRRLLRLQAADENADQVCAV